MKKAWLPLPAEVRYDFNRAFVPWSDWPQAKRCIDAVNDQRTTGPILMMLSEEDVEYAQKVASIRNDVKQRKGFERPMDNGFARDDNFVAVVGEAMVARHLFGDDGWSHVDTSDRIQGNGSIDFYWQDIPIAVRTSRDVTMLYLDRTSEKRLRNEERTDVVIVNTHVLGFKERDHPTRPRLRAYMELCCWSWVAGFWKRAAPFTFPAQGLLKNATEESRTVLALPCMYCRDIRTLKPSLAIWQKRLEKEAS